MRVRSNRDKKEHRTTVVLSEDQHTRMITLAERTDVSVAWLVRQAIAHFLDTHAQAAATAKPDMILRMAEKSQ